MFPVTPNSTVPGDIGTWLSTRGQAAAPEYSSTEHRGVAAMRLESDGRLARFALLVLLVPTLWFIATDVEVSAGDTSWLTARLGIRSVLVLTLVAGAWLIPASRDRAQFELRVLTVTLLAAGCLVGFNALRPAGSGLPLRTPMMWLFAFYAVFPSRLARQLAAPFVLTGGLMLLPSFWREASGWMNVAGNVLVLLTVNALGVLLSMRRRELSIDEVRAWSAEAAARERAEKALTELRVLRGTIPICAHCRKVRTDAGNWQMIESYVQAHTDAEFSHGICPSCMASHYPGY
ncbi:MAG: hypothetical protein ACT4OZ_03575 [Gemmatimonadota bacterium]